MYADVTAAVTVSMRIMPTSRAITLGDRVSGVVSLACNASTYSGELVKILGTILFLPHYKLAA